MRIAVTGGTGFIGKRVVRELCAAGHEVTCVVRRPAAATALEALGARLAQGDILDRASLARAFAGADAVYHLAASYEIGLSGARVDAALRSNIEGTRNALEEAAAAGARRILYTSTIAVNGTTSGREVDETFRYRSPFFASHYSRSKHLAHFEVAEPLMRAGAPIVILQPGAVLGPGDVSNFQAIFRYMVLGIPLPLGAARYALVGVEDCARAHLLALERGRIGESYYIVSENLSMLELARRAEQVSGVRARAVVLPDRLLRSLGALMRVLERVLPFPAELSSESMRSLCADITMTVSGRKAREELGFEPAPIDAVLLAIFRDELTRRRRRLTPALTSGSSSAPGPHVRALVRSVPPPG